MNETIQDYGAVVSGIVAPSLVYLQFINGILATITLLLALIFGLWRMWRWIKKGSPYPDGN